MRHISTTFHFVLCTVYIIAETTPNDKCLPHVKSRNDAAHSGDIDNDISQILLKLLGKRLYIGSYTRLFSFAPTTASRSPSPAHAGEALLRAVFSQNHAILASPADAGERSTSANHTSFYSCSWDVFPYDLFPVQLCPMGLLLGQVSKWRAQRADRGAHAARGFVGGAARSQCSSSVSAICFNAARGYSLSPPPPLRGPPPPLAQGRLFIYGMSASRPDTRDAGCCKVPSQREGATVF